MVHIYITTNHVCRRLIFSQVGWNGLHSVFQKFVACRGCKQLQSVTLADIIWVLFNEVISIGIKNLVSLVMKVKKEASIVWIKCCSLKV